LKSTKLPINYGGVLETMYFFKTCEGLEQPGEAKLSKPSKIAPMMDNCSNE